MGNGRETIKLEQRVDTSADLSDYVYKFERVYTEKAALFCAVSIKCISQLITRLAIVVW